MNFVDAAVALLREVEAPLHVEELCRLALERGLLDSPGANPLRSFKGRLTTELKRGDESRVVRVEDDRWTLSDAGREGGDVPAREEEGEADEAHEHEVDREHELDLRRDEMQADEDDADDRADDEDDEDEDDGDDDDESAGEELAAAPADEIGDGDDDGGEADDRQDEVGEPARELSPEEAELALVYGDEVGTAQVGALSEYRDAQTADEDRPMTPEMTGERRGRREREDWKTRRERMRRERREKRESRERERDTRQGGGNGAAAGATPAPRDPAAPRDSAPHGHGQAAASEAPHHHGEPAGSGPTDMARRACEVLASVKGGQPVPVKQLAQMMRKRRLVEEEPERMWRALKSALLADTQRRLGAGLPPRVVYRGRDLFAYRPSGNAELEAAEAGLEAAANRLRGATERTLAARLADMALPALEQVAYLYLVQTGWREIEWIKRVDRSGYATAREPGDGQVLLIGVRAGNQELDRRGVGELRAGIAAKNLTRGLLLAPRELGGEARSELERPGPPIAVMAGLPWAASLVQAGIAVSQRMVPVAYLDGELLDRLAEN